MKKRQVDTPWENSWADRMARGTIPAPRVPVHPTHQEEQKLMDARRRLS